MMNFLSKIIMENTDPEYKNTICKYYSIDDFNSKGFNANQYFSIFHLNIHSLQLHKNDLDILLDTLNLKFDIIALSETKLRKGINPITDISLPEYHQPVSTPSEASKGGTLLYISNKLNYKPRKDLEIYKSKQIESSFIEIINENGKNQIVGCIYKHHTISPTDFTKEMTALLSKISKEKKICYIAGDFNMNLLQLETNTDIEQYFDEITNNNFMPLISSPTRITRH